MPRDVHVLHACVVSIIKLLHTQSALSATEGVNKKVYVPFSFYGRSTVQTVPFRSSTSTVRKPYKRCVLRLRSKISLPFSEEWSHCRTTVERKWNVNFLLAPTVSQPFSSCAMFPYTSL